MAKTDNKSIFFLTLSFICIWVILDNIFGKKYLDTFLSNIFPFYNSTSKSTNFSNYYEANGDKYYEEGKKQGMTNEEAKQYSKEETAKDYLKKYSILERNGLVG